MKGRDLSMDKKPFYGVMLICPINRTPFEVLTEWGYKDGIWYGNGESFPEGICRIKEDEE